MDPSGAVLRDKAGRFVVGTGKLGGRKALPHREYLHILLEELTPEEWREIVKLAIADAKHPDSGAVRNMGRSWLSKYALGEVAAAATPEGFGVLQHLLNMSDEERRALARDPEPRLAAG